MTLLLVTSLAAGCALVRPAMPTVITGWTTAPTDPDPAFAAAATEGCADAPPVATVHDQRGPDAAMILLLEADAQTVCLVLRCADGVVRGTPLWDSDLHGTDDGLELNSGGSNTLGDGLEFTLYLGGAGEGAASVEVGLWRGPIVEATVSDGRYVAWWPGHTGSVEIRSFDAAGRLIERIDGTAAD